MKYCGKFSKKIDMSIFDEVAILYNHEDRAVITFLQEHINQRVVLIVRDFKEFAFIEEWKKLNAIHEQYPEFNFAVCFGEARKFEEAPAVMVQCMENLQIPFFTGYVAANFDQLNYLCSLGVSDVYLAEDICFDLKRAKRVCSNHNVQIRAFPNVGQSGIKSGPALKKFFIRPEDVEEYSDVIDILEFWGPLDRQATLHKIYTKGVWFGDLKDLILDLDLSFDSRRIMPGFAYARKVCGRKCMKGESCAICDRVYSISEKLADKKLIIKKQKNS